jgi:phytoene dehydrogenase-like protein
MSNRIFDAIVIGAGHNGLVAAAYLAKAGQRVLVLEAAAQIGGATGVSELAPGYSAPALAHVVEGMPHSIERDLKLKRYGLRYPRQKMPTIALSRDSDPLHLSEKNYQGTMNLSEADKDALRDFRAEISAYAKIILPVLKEASPAAREEMQAMLCHLNWRIVFSRHASLSQLMQLLPMSIGDRLDAAFDDARLKGILAVDALLGGSVGPYEAGTWFRLVYREAMRKLGRGVSHPIGGVPMLAQALAEAAVGMGVDIRLNVKVTRIITRSEIVTGVETDAGTTVSAPLVISSLDPATSLGSLVGGARFEVQGTMRINRSVSRGMSAKINLALNRLPDFRRLDQKDLKARLLIAPSIEDLDAAYIQAKRGEEPVDSLYEIVIPTMHSGNDTPPDHHVVSIVKHYAPYANKEDHDPLTQTINILERYAPFLGRSIIAAEYLSPQTIETRYSLRGGGWYQGDMRVDQLFAFRPAVGFAHNSTPISGLYLCGAGCHPGGGISGLSGKFAADAALSRRKRN